MVLRYKATIPESKVFFRTYAVKSDMNLFSFNNFILADLGFSPDQMVVFEGYDTSEKLCGEYGLFDLGDGSMDRITFEKLRKDEIFELHYIYDMRNDRYVKLVLEGGELTVPERLCPCLMEEKGHGPEQFNTRYEDYEAVPAPGAPHSTPADDEDFDDDDLDDEDEDDEENDEEEEVFDESEM